MGPKVLVREGRVECTHQDGEDATMMIDPIYLIVMGAGLLLSLGAQAWVKGAVAKWERVSLQRPMTGAEVAAQILRASQIDNVRIEPVAGVLTDHYDPRSRTLRLSRANYAGRSIAAAGIAAHEAGHAIQHRDGYKPMFLRQRMVPVANLGTNLGILLVMAGLFVGVAGLAQIGVLLFAGFVGFTLVTLPVEFDASHRAKRALEQSRITTPEETRAVAEVLRAAAATYVAAAVTAVLQLLYFAWRAGLLRRR